MNETQLEYERNGNKWRNPHTTRTHSVIIEVDEIRVRTDGAVEGYRDGIGVEQIEQGDTQDIIVIRDDDSFPFKLIDLR